MMVIENSIETFNGAEADAKAFARRLRGKFPCFVMLEWNGSFHASEYQIVATNNLEDCDRSDVAISVNSTRDAKNAFLMLVDQRLEAIRVSFKNSREF